MTLGIDAMRGIAAVMSRFLLAGSDHELVPPSRLTEISSQSARIQTRLLELRKHDAIHGALLLSTCNRVEVLVELDARLDAEPDAGFARELLGCGSSFPIRELEDADAIEHFLGVAIGLHSMVFGEEQILGQVRRAYKSAEEHGLLSRRLQMLRSRLLSTASEVRKEAGLDHRPRSVAAMAADEVMTAGPRLAVVGAGATGRLVLEVMQRRGVRDPLVVNRTLAAAEALAEHFDGRAMSLRDFTTARPALDGVVFAVHSDRPLLTRELALGLKTVVDISQPSVVEREVFGISGLRVITLDELSAVAARAIASQSATKAAGITLVSGLARQLWTELEAGRPNLGRVVDLHVEGAMAELDSAFDRELRHLPASDRDALRNVVMRTARRNAHFHIQDIRQLAGTR
ncbi:MAG: hypothetical protein HZB39_11750 [Planctomycetes bacterium]|nr:hypothetical protein [Planctomycetota bacterium]